MCGNKVQVPKMESISLNEVEPVLPMTKSFGYTKYYCYGESDQKIEYEEMKFYVVDVPSADDLVSCIIHDIHDIFEKEKDTYKRGHILRAVVLFVVNHHSIPESDENEPSETSSTQIPLYHIGKDKSSFLNIELIESECLEVFHSDENDLSSDDDDFDLVSSDDDD